MVWTEDEARSFAPEEFPDSFDFFRRRFLIGDHMVQTKHHEGIGVCQYLLVERQLEPGLIDSLTSDIAVAKEDIAPGAVGRAELRGTVWSALNVGIAALHRGQRCAVRKVDGLTLHISAEGA